MRVFKVEKKNGVWIKHAPCPACRALGRDRAGDNLQIYEQEDGTYDATCMACHTYYDDFDVGGSDDTSRSYRGEGLVEVKDLQSIELVDRALKLSHTQFYGVKSKVVNGVETERYYPVTKKGVVTGYKKRTLPKTFGGNVGDCKGDIELFGQYRFREGGKILIITAGEEDAMSAYRITEYKSPRSRGYASVSLPNGAGDVKAIKNNLEWINTFEKVVFAVDQEELDLQKAQEYCDLLEPGKGHVATFSLNDANEMCKAGLFTEFYQSVWDAKKHMPSGIVEGQDVWLEYKKKDDYTTVPFPKEWGLDDINYGLYYPSLFVLTAGTGVGKSTILKHLQYHVFENTNLNMGIISMEEPMHLCAGILMGLNVKKRITLPDVKISEQEERNACKELFEGGRFVFCDNTGIRTPEDLYSKIRFMANARDCKIIFLDHLTAIVNKFSGMGSKNDYTEQVVNNLNDLCQELGVCIVLVSHVRKTSGDSDGTYETGKVPSEDSIFGSSSIKQYSYATLAVSRDKGAENSPMFIHILKDRLSGRTGKSSPLFYNGETGWLYSSKPEDKDEIL